MEKGVNEIGTFLPQGTPNILKISPRCTESHSAESSRARIFSLIYLSIYRWKERKPLLIDRENNCKPIHNLAHNGFPHQCP